MTAEDRTFTCAECRRTWPYDAVDKVPSLKHKACICETCASPKAFNHFGGATYDPARDRERLGAQFCTVVELMADGKARTLQEIARETGFPEASISARLRDIRKHYGTDAMESKRLSGGCWTYTAHIEVAA
ncbi:hypothetical protein [Hyphomonas sp. CY54-11-8]|uniref:hypothetical protein n=1 Tax=Hyphomonas sp. CY54-11-8 TaxID=1280944 RepID=UPI000458BD1B|nr:hypothetical protein [Hyphomonas sp. CY54-11-8]KCZ47750.1 hypothetical protein HY17_04545 [Hyphomonas sp. CY54-11-8]